MQTFHIALDHVSPENWVSLEGDVEVMMLRSTGDAPALTEATVAAVLSGGAVEITDTAYVREVVSSHAVLTSGNNRALDCDSVTWTAVGDSGAGQTVLGALFYLKVTNDADSIPLLWAPEFTGTLNGGDVVLQVPAGGLWLFDADPA